MAEVLELQVHPAGALELLLRAKPRELKLAIEDDLGGFTEVVPVRVRPSVALRIRISIARVRTARDEQRPWRAQRDQLMIVHRQITCIQRTRITQELPIEPVIQRRPRKVRDRLTVDVPVQLRPTLA